LLKKYVDSIQISMEGVSREKYEFIRGRNTYDTLLRSFSLINEYKIPVVLAITALDEVFDDIEEYLTIFIQNLALDNITIRLNDEIENKGNAIHLSQSNFKINYDKKVRIRDLLFRLRELGYYSESVKARNIHFSNCGIGTNIVINHDGGVYPCIFFERPFFSIEDSPEIIIEYFNNLNKSTALNTIAKCNSCEIKYVCNGGCRLLNRLRNNDYSVAFCTEEMKEQKLLSLFTSSLE